MRLQTNLIVQERRKLPWIVLSFSLFFLQFSKAFWKDWMMDGRPQYSPSQLLSANQWEANERKDESWLKATKQHQKLWSANLTFGRIHTTTVFLWFIVASMKPCLNGWNFVLFVLWLRTCCHCHITRKQLLLYLKTWVGFWRLGFGVCLWWGWVWRGKNFTLMELQHSVKSPNSNTGFALLDTQNCLSLRRPHSRSRPPQAGETQDPEVTLTSMLHQLPFWIGLSNQKKMRALSLFLLLHPPRLLSDPSLTPSTSHPTFNNSSELSGKFLCY